MDADDCVSADLRVGITFTDDHDLALRPALAATLGVQKTFEVVHFSPPWQPWQFFCENSIAPAVTLFASKFEGRRGERIV